MTVHEVTAAGSNNVAPLVTLVAAADDAQVVFATAASTFNALAAQGDNGVLVQVDLSSVATGVYLDADLDNSSTADTANSLEVADARTITARTLLTLEASQGSITPVGTLTLAAGSGIVVLDSMAAANNGKLGSYMAASSVASVPVSAQRSEYEVDGKNDETDSGQRDIDNHG